MISEIDFTKLTIILKYLTFIILRANSAGDKFILILFLTFSQ